VRSGLPIATPCCTAPIIEPLIVTALCAECVTAVDIQACLRHGKDHPVVVTDRARQMWGDQLIYWEGEEA
jgi:hypothetical protein